MNFYTNVFQRGDYIYLREVNDGVKKSSRIQFYPTVWINGQLKASEEWKTLFGESVYSFKPGTIRETKKYIEDNKTIVGREVYTPPGYQYQFIAENYKKKIEWNKKNLSVYIIDIETKAENGFPEPKYATEELLLISVKDQNSGMMYTFGRNPFSTSIENCKYIHCESEESLIRSFLSWWASSYPDILTGWNSVYFDLTYLYNRIVNVLGENIANKLSPWGFVYQREETVGTRTDIKTSILGVSCLDYLDLYKKFGPRAVKESYKLDHIAYEELKENKLENPEPVFRDFYRLHWNTFCEYNIHDVNLVDRLDNKLKLIDLAITMAYEAKCNFEDVYSPVKTWDVITYNYLNDRNIVIPIKKYSQKVSFEGGYVKNPLRGKHNWVASFDLDSLYPHLIMHYNISTETIRPVTFNVDIEGLLNKEYDFSEAYANNLSVAANGCCFSREERGLFPTLMDQYYEERKVYKKEMLAKKQEYELNPSEELSNEISRLNNMQMAIKILINAFYGQLANAYSRYFDLRLARAITLSGQLSIRWVANDINKFMNDTFKTPDKDNVILVDTDSVVVSFESIVEKMCAGKDVNQKISYMDKISDNIIQPLISRSYDDLYNYMNAFEQKMHMKRENLIDTMVSIEPKNYVMSVYNSEGVQYKEPKLKIMGLQMIKSITPTILKPKLKDSLKIILYGNEVELQNYIFNYKDEYLTFSPEDIAFPRGITELSKYANDTTIYGKGCPIHVRGALLYNHYLKMNKLTHKYPIIKDGDKIKFLYLKTPNSIYEDCIGFIDKLPEEFDLHKYIDYNLMYEKTFQDALSNTVKPLGWCTEKKLTLEDWFE